METSRILNLNERLQGKFPTDGKRKQVLCLLKQIDVIVVIGAWAEDKQTHSPLVKICTKKAPHA